MLSFFGDMLPDGIALALALIALMGGSVAGARRAVGRDRRRAATAASVRRRALRRLIDPSRLPAAESEAVATRSRIAQLVAELERAQAHLHEIESFIRDFRAYDSDARMNAAGRTLAPNSAALTGHAHQELARAGRH